MAQVVLSVESQSVVKASDQYTFSSFFTLFLKLLDFSNGVLTYCLSAKSAILNSTGTFAMQVPGKVVNLEEVSAAMNAEHYTEKRKD